MSPKRDHRLPEFHREVFNADGVLAARFYGTASEVAIRAAEETAMALARAHGYELGMLVPEADGGARPVRPVLIHVGEDGRASITMAPEGLHVLIVQENEPGRPTYLDGQRISEEAFRREVACAEDR